jgi:hypothetical protein
MNPETPIEHAPYTEPLFTNRFIKHADLKLKIEEIKQKGIFKVKHAGNSVQQREIYHLSIGQGKTKILLWSQMHGDEPTGTLAFFDLFNFFAASDEHNALRKIILDNCTLHFIPLLNPDGATMHQRRNAQEIDINRDFLNRQSPEANILINLQQSIQPDFCFNMHDQETLWSVSGSKKPATISLLAPPADEDASLKFCRFRAMLVVASINQFLEKKIPGNIGRWSEEFEPRAFGDNFQRLGSSTILIEGGGYPGDFEKQYARKLTFELLTHALTLIAEGQYVNQQIANYYAIPNNNRELFHLLIKNCKIAVENTVITADIGLNYTEVIDLENHQHTKTYTIADMGDLSTWNAYDIFEADGAVINQPVILNTQPSFTIANQQGHSLNLQNGLIK